MRSILIKLRKKQILNDVAVLCTVIGRELQRNPDTEEKGGDIMNLDDPITMPIVARAITEGFGEVKRICQRYLIMGRDTDDNRLERINDMLKFKETVQSGNLGNYSLLTGQTYLIRVSEECSVMTSEDVLIKNLSKGSELEYTATGVERLKFICDADNVEVTYLQGEFGALELELSMPSTFNLGMTETAKSCAHRIIVDYVMQSLLQNQWSDKAAEYAAKLINDAAGLRNAIHARTTFRRNAPDWS